MRGTIWMGQRTVPAAEGSVIGGSVAGAGGHSVSSDPLPPAAEASGDPATPRRGSAALRRTAWWLAGILTLVAAATTAAFAHAACSRPAAQLCMAAANTVDYRGCAIFAARMPIFRRPYCVPKPVTPGA